jgi:hypothetical protein
MKSFKDLIHFGLLQREQVAQTRRAVRALGSAAGCGNKIFREGRNPISLLSDFKCLIIRNLRAYARIIFCHHEVVGHVFGCRTDGRDIFLISYSAC